MAPIVELVVGGVDQVVVLTPAEKVAFGFVVDFLFAAVGAFK